MIQGRPSFFQRPKPPAIDTTSVKPSCSRVSAANAERFPAGAVDDDGPAAVDELGLGLALEVATGDEHRTGDRALVVLVLLTHVDEGGLARGGPRPSSGWISVMRCLVSRSSSR